MKRLLLAALALGSPAWAENVRTFPDPGLRVLRQMLVQSGGRTITLNRIAPPPLVARPAPAEPPPPSPEELAIIQRREGKRQEILSLSATIFDREVTALRWFFEGREYRAFSNLDFNFLRGLAEIETEDVVYFLFFGFGEETREGGPQDLLREIPALSEFSRTRSEYVLSGKLNSPEKDPTLAGLGALHLYFDAHRAELLAAWEKREAQRIAHERWMREHPPGPPPPLVLNYWPGEGTVVFDAPAKGGKP